MNKDLHDHTDDLFKKALDDHEETPSSAIWETIDKNLDKKNLLSMHQRYTNLKRVAVILLILLTGISFYELQKVIRTNQVATVSTHENNSTAKSSSPHPAPAAPDRTEPGSPISPSSSNKAATENTNNKKSATPVSKQNNIKELNSVTEQNQSSTKENTAQASKQHSANSRVDDVAKNKKHDQQQVVSNSRNATRQHPFLLNSNGDYSDHTIERNTKKSKPDPVTLSSQPLSSTIAMRPLTTPVPLQPSAPLTFANLSAVIHSSTAFPTITLNNSPVKKRAKSSLIIPLSATVFFAPSALYNHLENDRHDFMEDDRNKIKGEERQAFSYTAGVLLQYDVTKTWSVQSGVSFTQMTTAIEPKTIYARHDRNGNVGYRFNCSSGYSYIPPRRGTAPALGDSIKAFASKNYLQYINIPVGLQYRIGKGKFSIAPVVGLSANFLMSQKIETAIGTGNNKEVQVLKDINGLKSVYFNSMIGIGAAYQLTKTIAVSITPTAGLALTSVTKDAPVKSYPKTFGVAGGIHVRF